MQLSPELITALGGILLAVLGWMSSAKKGDVDALREIIEAQTKTIDRLRERVDLLERENEHYQRLLARHGIDPNTETSPPPTKARDLWGRL